MTLAIERPMNFGPKPRQRQRDAVLEAIPEGRTPRVAKLLALALKCEALIAQGGIANQIELGMLGQITRARVTQIMNLTLLAPDIQDEVLHLPRVHAGRDPLVLRDLQPLAALLTWRSLRVSWQQLKGPRKLL
jgi:hypothetical protein